MEAAARLLSVGPNEVAHEARHTILVEIISRSVNPLNVLLLTLAAVSYLLGDQRAAIVIAIMVLLSVSLGFLKSIARPRQQMRCGAWFRPKRPCAGRTADRGTAMSGSARWFLAHRAAVSRRHDPGGIRLISANDLFINQSTLTGEAMPLEKNADPHAGKAELRFDLPNVCFMGSAVVSGVGCGVVVLTGARTAFGQVAGTIAKQRVLTSFDKGITRGHLDDARPHHDHGAARVPDQRPDARAIGLRPCCSR